MRSSKKKAFVTPEGNIVAQGKTWDPSKLQAFRDYQVNYNKETYRAFFFRASKVHEVEIIDWLEAKDNLSGYIKDLVIKDMEKNNIFLSNK